MNLQDPEYSKSMVLCPKNSTSCRFGGYDRAIRFVWPDDFVGGVIILAMLLYPSGFTAIVVPLSDTKIPLGTKHESTYWEP